MRSRLARDLLGGSADPRVADVERRAASLMKTKRNTHRRRHEKKSDMPPVRAHDGTALQCDAKSKRRGVPRWMTDGFDECRSYSPHAVPVLLVYPLGGEPIAILPAEAFARIAGIQQQKPGEQLALVARSA